MTVRNLNLVTPLAHEATAMHITDTASSASGRSGAVSPVIGASLRQSDVDSVNKNSPALTTRFARTSTTAIRTTTTRTTSSSCALSADTFVATNKSHAGFSFERLVQAYFDCRKRKRNTASALAFEVNLERNLTTLYRSLVDGTYKIGKTICFDISHPKPREVWAADFRDRIVHHFLYNHIAPRFESSFIADSSACMKGRGTLYAVERLESKIRSITQNWSKPAYYLKLDLANFFVSIDKTILHELLVKKIHEPEWQALTEQILLHDCRQHYARHGKAQKVPAHKRLINQSPDRGLPIGNLPSQFFANVYLNELDQFVKHKLRAKHYVRYVDDFILLHESPQQLNAWLKAIVEFLPARLNAQINPSKTIIQPIDRGVDFVGQVIKPWRRTARRRVLKQAIKRIETAEPVKLLETANSYYGLLRQSSHSYQDRVTLTHAVLARGNSVNRQLTKTYKKSR